MEIHYADKNFEDPRDVTHPYTDTEFMFPDMKVEYELHSMHVRKTKDSWYFPSHEHPLYELNYVTKGTQLFSVRNQTFQMNEGDLVFIRPGELHHSSNAANHGGGFTYFCMHFKLDDKILLPFLKESTESYYPADSLLNRSVHPYLNRLMDYSLRTSFSFMDKMMIHSTMFELIGTMMTSLEKEQKSDVSQHVVSTAHCIAQEIDTALKKPSNPKSGESHVVRIEEIAEQLNISLSYCQKVFKKVYHMSPRQYVTFRKLNEAKSLLIQDVYTIEQIAFVMGYHDSSHFSRQFKRWTGMSPGTYRTHQSQTREGAFIPDLDM
ncbi:helix-turn-helix domain-containing protein [Bacillus lacus]|uniref:Helix-turn-helix domain-containing protein n=1 Tax=Metabacillus lacus TaxID=1983721 RepID=A0A7X2LY01_9BACI|nr:AraC family transcriptional regulator [Metabacillus lacus]MRX71258.1 helix-turn-helix domain-containing protein [Metabacillus lacus]